MKIRVISNKDELESVQPNEKIVHLAFRPSNLDFFKLYDSCPKIEAIQIPKSYKKTVSKSIMMFFDMHNIVLIEGDVWGHRKDLCEHYVIPTGIIEMVKEMKSQNKSSEFITQIVKKEGKYTGDLAEYIVRNIKV
jgi:vacuolar-type H+-ATPase subunit C/Vma6